MLTNVYYYGFYKPYIINKSRRATDNAYKYKNNSTKSDSSKNPAAIINVNLQKNNAVKRDVIKYAQDIYKNVTEMKDSSKYLRNNAETYYLNVLDESFESAKNWAIEDISFFVDSYNDAVEFGLNQSHSTELLQFAADIRNIGLENKEVLDAIGIDISEDGNTMSFEADKLQDLDYLEFGTVLSRAKQVSDKIYNRTRNVLDKPLTQHMSFKQLSYYYNYSISRKQGNGFSLIASGLILDKII